jgi:hypothetical protein
VQPESATSAGLCLCEIYGFGIDIYATVRQDDGVFICQKAIRTVIGYKYIAIGSQQRRI